jgi:hypothetical protein
MSVYAGDGTGWNFSPPDAACADSSRFARLRLGFDSGIGMDAELASLDRRNSRAERRSAVAAGQCGGRNKSVSELCTTAPTCNPTWAIGAPIGLSVARVGTLQIRSPVIGFRSLSDRKSL